MPSHACHFVEYILIGTAVVTATSSCHRLQFQCSVYAHKRDRQQMARALRSICLDSTAAHEFGCQGSICQSLCLRLHFVCVACPCEHAQHSSLGGPCRRGCSRIGSAPHGLVRSLSHPANRCIILRTNAAARRAQSCGSFIREPTRNLLHSDEIAIWLFCFRSVSCNEKDSKKRQ